MAKKKKKKKESRTFYSKVVERAWGLESQKLGVESLPLPLNSSVSLHLLAYLWNLVKQVNSVYFRRRQWHPTPVLLPGKSYGRRTLVDCSPWGRWGSNTTEWLHFHFSFPALEKERATHSSVLAWRIPGTGEPGGCRLWGHTESDTTEAT